MTTPTSAGTSSIPSGTFRHDIQGLRAVAVGLVVIFHMFPLASMFSLLFPGS